MKDITGLTAYLGKIIGRPALLRRIAPKRLDGLPAFLASAYCFYEWNWLNQALILAVDPSGKEPVAPADLNTHHRILASHFGRSVVFVMPAMDAYQRNRLVHLAVPFIVPEFQLFIPPFASLCDQFRRTVRAGKLSGAAQTTVLYQILRHPPAVALLNQWAKWLGYSPMTMTKVRDELAANNLCVREIGAKPRGLRFSHRGRALWEAALPFLRSPVRRTCWARIPKAPSALLRAGLTALSHHTLVEDDSLPTYACRDTEWKRLIASRQARSLEHPDDANARVECWRYEPGLLAEDATVDRLSLFLALSDSEDERVRLACDTLLEGIPW